jgi:hypothetical protein
MDSSVRLPIGRNGPVDEAVGERGGRLVVQQPEDVVIRHGAEPGCKRVAFGNYAFPLRYRLLPLEERVRDAAVKPERDPDAFFGRILLVGVRFGNAGLCARPDLFRMEANRASHPGPARRPRRCAASLIMKVRRSMAETRRSGCFALV